VIRAAVIPAVVALVAMSVQPVGAVPQSGMAGLRPNASTLAVYVVANYPTVKAIGGVRPDPLPDHPSGRAIDIMVGGDAGLGDQIYADLQADPGRFSIEYMLWRVAYHFDHIHVTVS
jgi:hypothetical protein